MRILVADDMPSLRMLARVTLAGHDISEASDGEEALHLIHSLRPDVVLLDINMPNMSGLEVCHEVRRDPSLADTYIIVITANSQENMRRALEAGADIFLGKPFSPRALSGLITELSLRPVVKQSV